MGVSAQRTPWRDGAANACAGTWKISREARFDWLAG